MARRKVYVRDRRGRFARVRGTAAAETLAGLRGRRRARGRAVKIVGRASVQRHVGRQRKVTAWRSDPEFDRFGAFTTRGYRYRRTHASRSGSERWNRYDSSGKLLRSGLMTRAVGSTDFRGRRVKNFRRR